MSQENAETARQAVEAFNRRDRDAWLLLAIPGFLSMRRGRRFGSFAAESSAGYPGMPRASKP